MDLYSVLDIDKSASDSEIKKAYRKKALKCHPDKKSDPEAVEQFQNISKAYNILSDPEKKHLYDTKGVECDDIKDADIYEIFKQEFEQHDVTPNCEQTISLTLEELYNGVKNILKTINKLKLD